MPQPLPHSLRDTVSYSIGSPGDSVFLKRPDLSVLALSAIGTWSRVEFSFLRMFVVLMGGPETLSASIYVGLETQSAKTTAITVAANSLLKDRPDELRAVKALIKLAKTHQKSRNKLAHWMWGYSDQLPKALLLMDPKSNVGRPGRSDIFVYTESDFNAQINANETLCQNVDYLFMAILIPTHTLKRQSLVDRVLKFAEGSHKDQNSS
jgi:hypothetical protein